MYQFSLVIIKTIYYAMKYFLPQSWSVNLQFWVFYTAVAASTYYIAHNVELNQQHAQSLIALYLSFHSINLTELCAFSNNRDQTLQYHHIMPILDKRNCLPTTTVQARTLRLGASSFKIILFSVTKYMAYWTHRLNAAFIRALQ